MSDAIDRPAPRPSLIREMFVRPIPGGAGWRNVLGVTTVLLFLVQVVTGLLLMTVYSPSTATAWGSVWYIQTQLPGGWFIRGLHHFTSDALLIVIALHLLQMIVLRTYRSGGVAVWVITGFLLCLVLALSLSGHLLPWDQAGYWGTMVRTNILSKIPLVGDAIQRLLVGGREFGELTLTRFYALHVAVLPIAGVALLAWRFLHRRRRYGQPPEDDITSTDNRAEPYYHRQLLLDSLAFFVVFAGVVGVLTYVRIVQQSALLAAPADPAAADYPARPEWHTLFLYQWLKSFEGPTAEIVGAVIAPSLLAILYLMFPWLDRGGRRAAGRWSVMGVTLMTVAGICWLSFAALQADRDPSDAAVRSARSKQRAGESLTVAEKAVLRARQYNEQVERAGKMAARAMVLASENGIPPEGALSLLRNDPLTRGPELFARHCASCHRYDGHDGLGGVPAEPPTSSDLHNFATRAWIRGLLDDPMADDYLGRMKQPDGDPAHTRMQKFLRELREDHEGEQAARALSAKLDAVAAYLEDESLHPGRLAGIGTDDGLQGENSGDSALGEVLRGGRKYFVSVCNECHSYDGYRAGIFHGPEMRGYGSVAWIELMIAEPGHELRYRSRGQQPAQMPPFVDRLTEKERSLIARWLHDSRNLD